MKQLLRTPNLSLAHSLKLALAAEGIGAVVRGQELAGVLGDPFSVEVIDEDKFEQARAVLARLERASPST